MSPPTSTTPLVPPFGLCHAKVPGHLRDGKPKARSRTKQAKAIYALDPRRTRPQRQTRLGIRGRAEPARNLSMPHVVPDASSWPVRIVQSSKRSVPDYTGGPALGIVVVSEGFKSLVESWDPVPHHFIPLEITRPDGTVAKGTNHIFKLGSFVENGIVTEKILGPRRFLEGRRIPLSRENAVAAPDMARRCHRRKAYLGRPAPQTGDRSLGPVPCRTSGARDGRFSRDRRPDRIATRTFAGPAVLVHPRCSFTGSVRPSRRKCAMKGRVASSVRVAA
jgi:hypothetical protein